MPPGHRKVFAHTQVRDPRESATACSWPGLGTPSPWPSSLWPTYSSHEKFWPTSENGPWRDSNFHSMFTLQIAVVTSNTGPILVFPRIQPFGSNDFSSLGKVYSRHVTGSVDCKNSSVCFVMKCCPTSTVFRKPASVQIFINRSCCERLSTRSLYFCNKSSCAGSSVEGVGVFINKLVGTNNGSDCPANTGLSVLVWQALYSSRTSETAP